MSLLLTTLNNFPLELRGGGVAIGNFDAVHIGHAALIRQLVALSRSVHGPALVFTFDPPPGAILQPTRPRNKPLTTIARRAALVGQLGADALLAYPTDSDFLQLSAEDFFDQMIVQTLGARVMVEGPSFRFGRGRQGDIQLLGGLCQAAGIDLHVLPCVTAGAITVSSTRIRELVGLGDMAAANGLLLEPYRLQGMVVRGAQRGRLIGFPTANLASIPVLLPAAGVYAGRVRGIGDTPLAAAIHIGPNLTFEESEPKVEVHIVNWNGSLYGQELEVEVLDRVRETRKFPSVDELQSQMRLDVGECVRRAAIGV